MGYNIKADHVGTGCVGVDWTGSAYTGDATLWPRLLQSIFYIIFLSWLFNDALSIAITERRLHMMNWRNMA
jgi:hypothetical protein